MPSLLQFLVVFLPYLKKVEQGASHPAGSKCTESLYHRLQLASQQELLRVIFSIRLRCLALYWLFQSSETDAFARQPKGVVAVFVPFFRLKNPNSKLVQTLNSGFSIRRRIALTGMLLLPRAQAVLLGVPLLWAGDLLGVHTSCVRPPASTRRRYSSAERHRGGLGAFEFFDAVDFQRQVEF